MNEDGLHRDVPSSQSHQGVRYSYHRGTVRPYAFFYEVVIAVNGMSMTNEVSRPGSLSHNLARATRQRQAGGRRQ